MRGRCNGTETFQAMAPRRREDGQPPPVYNDNGQYFTIAINYGGFFLGSGINRSYLGGVIDCYDFYESDKWNIRALDRVFEDTIIIMSEVSRVLWCFPGQSVKNFGLADITNDDDCSNMPTTIAIGHKVFLCM